MRYPISVRLWSLSVCMGKRSIRLFVVFDSITKYVLMIRKWSACAGTKYCGFQRNQSLYGTRLTVNRYSKRYRRVSCDVCVFFFFFTSPTVASFLKIIIYRDATLNDVVIRANATYKIFFFFPDRLTRNIDWQ